MLLQPGITVSAVLIKNFNTVVRPETIAAAQNHESSVVVDPSVVDPKLFLSDSDPDLNLILDPGLDPDPDCF